MGGPLKGWLMASKAAGAAAQDITWAALGRGCGREGGGALPLPRAVVVSTRVRLQCTTSLLYSSPGKKWSMYLG